MEEGGAGTCALSQAFLPAATAGHNRNARSKEAGQVSLALAPLGRPWLPCYCCTWQGLRLTAGIHWRPGEESRFLLREHSPVLRAQAGQGVRRSQAPEPAPGPPWAPRLGQRPSSVRSGVCLWPAARLLADLARRGAGRRQSQEPLPPAGLTPGSRPPPPRP